MAKSPEQIQAEQALENKKLAQRQEELAYRIQAMQAKNNAVGLAPQNYQSASQMQGLPGGYGSAAGGEAIILPTGFQRELQYQNPELQQLQTPPGSQDIGMPIIPDFDKLYLNKDYRELLDVQRQGLYDLASTARNAGFNILNPDASNKDQIMMSDQFNRLLNEYKSNADKLQVSQINYEKSGPDVVGNVAVEGSAGLQAQRGYGYFGTEQAASLAMNPEELMSETQTWLDKYSNNPARTTQEFNQMKQQRQQLVDTLNNQIERAKQDNLDPNLIYRLERNRDALLDPRYDSLDAQKLALEQQKYNRQYGSVKDYENLRDQIWRIKNHMDPTLISDLPMRNKNVREARYLDSNTIGVIMNDGTEISIDLNAPDVDKAIFKLITAGVEGYKDYSYENMIETTSDWKPSDQENYQVKFNSEDWNKSIDSLSQGVEVEDKSGNKTTKQVWNKSKERYANIKTIADLEPEKYAPNVDEDAAAILLNPIKESLIGRNITSEFTVPISYTEVDNDGKVRKSETSKVLPVNATIEDVRVMNNDEYKAQIVDSDGEFSQAFDRADDIGYDAQKRVADDFMNQKNVVVEYATQEGDRRTIKFNLNDSKEKAAFERFSEEYGAPKGQFFEKQNTGLPSAGATEALGEKGTKYKGGGGGVTRAKGATVQTTTGSSSNTGGATRTYSGSDL